MAFKESMGRMSGGIKNWFNRRRDNVRTWWQSNPQKRGLAATSLVLLISNAVLATLVIVNTTNYTFTLEYYTTYWDQDSMSSVSISIPKSTYNAYFEKDHNITTYTVDKYEAFCTGDSLWVIAMQIKNSLGWFPSEERVISAILSFVQDKFNGARGLHYQYDTPTREYPKFPLETLVDRGGDCEDLAILFASLVEAIGYQALLVAIPQHMFAAVAMKSPPTHDNGTVYHIDRGDLRYYCCECTSYYLNVGVVPDNSLDEYTAIEVIF